VAVFVLWVGRRELRARPALLAIPIVGLVIGLSVYLYIPIAVRFSPPLVYNDPLTLDGFLFLVTGEQFRGQFDFLSGSGPAEFVRSLPDLWTVLIARGFAWGPFRLESGSLLLPIVIIGVVYVPYVARPIRGEVMSLRQKEFVEAAIGLGASTWRLLWSDVLRNVVTTVIVFFRSWSRSPC
jgi:ABC-type dipeptide/oligopeptide/nickel transport system permease subunit